MKPTPAGEDVKVSFGDRKVTSTEKTELVDNVFATVAHRYDVMNDLMSLGTHRLFKRMLVEMSGARAGHRILDLAGGTGDVARLFAPVVGKSGVVVLADQNSNMMAVGRDRMLNAGLPQVSFCQVHGEALPFADGSFDCATISFGLRNFTDKDRSLTEMARVLKPGGVLLVLEFSRPAHPLVATAYGAFQALWPPVGMALVGDAAPYRYLVESIRRHPNQQTLKQMFEDAGFIDVSFANLLGGIAAIHRGVTALASPQPREDCTAQAT